MTSQAAVACALVADRLKNRPRAAAEVLAAAESAKISARSIQRAAVALGVVKTRAGFRGGWTWKLPTDEQEAAKAPECADSKITARVEPADAKVAIRSEGDANGDNTGMVEHAAPAKDRKVSEQPSSRAEVIADRLRRLESARGMNAPIYANDPRLLRWVEASIIDPDLREAYERAVTDIEGDGPVTVGYLAKFVAEVISQGDKA